MGSEAPAMVCQLKEDVSWGLRANGAGQTRECPGANSTRKQLGTGARIPIMARHQSMPTVKAGYTYAVVPYRHQVGCLQNEGESIYGHLARPDPLTVFANGLARGAARQGLRAIGT